MVIMSRDCLMRWKVLDGNSKALFTLTSCEPHPRAPPHILVSPARFLRHELLRTDLALVGHPSGNLQESMHKHTLGKENKPRAYSNGSWWGCVFLQKCPCCLDSALLLILIWFWMMGVLLKTLTLKAKF